MRIELFELPFDFDSFNEDCMLWNKNIDASTNCILGSQ